MDGRQLLRRRLETTRPLPRHTEFIRLPLNFYVQRNRSENVCGRNVRQEGVSLEPFRSFSTHPPRGVKGPVTAAETGERLKRVHR